MWKFIKSFNIIDSYLVGAIALLLVLSVYFYIINPV